MKIIFTVSLILLLVLVDGTMDDTLINGTMDDNEIKIEDENQEHVRKIFWEGEIKMKYIPSKMEKSRSISSRLVLDLHPERPRWFFLYENGDFERYNKYKTEKIDKTLRADIKKYEFKGGQSIRITRGDGKWKFIFKDFAQANVWMNVFNGFNEDFKTIGLVKSFNQNDENATKMNDLKLIEDYLDRVNINVNFLNLDQENLDQENEVVAREKHVDKIQEENDEIVFENENANFITLKDIIWESKTLSKDDISEEIHQDYIWRVNDSTKMLGSSFNLNLRNYINHLEEKVNQLYKYTNYKRTPTGKHWCLRLIGNFQNSNKPFESLIPISRKLIDAYSDPGIKELNSVLNFGKFGDLVKKFPGHWNDLKWEHFSAIKLYLFSRQILHTPDFKDDKLLEIFQKELLKIPTEYVSKCPYGHGSFTRPINFKKFDCNICCKTHGGWNEHSATKCNECDYKNMCQDCFNSTKFGANTKTALEIYLRKKTGKMYEENILQDFLEYICRLNWKINLTDNTKEIPSENKRAMNLKNTRDSNKSDLNHAIQSVHYHEFLMDIESDPTKLDDWTYELDISQLEERIIDYEKSEWRLVKIIPPNVTLQTKFEVGYTNEDHIAKEYTKSKIYSWSVKAGAKKIGGFECGKTFEEIDTNLNDMITTKTQTGSQEITIESRHYARHVYILTFYGRFRSNEIVTWNNPDFIIIRDADLDAPTIDDDQKMIYQNLHKWEQIPIVDANHKYQDNSDKIN